MGELLPDGEGDRLGWKGIVIVVGAMHLRHT